MTPARSALVAVIAVLLIATLPAAGADEQYPRGLMASSPSAPDRVCTIETLPVSFGTYDPLSTAALDAAGKVIYTCGNQGAQGDFPIRIEMSAGSNTFNERRMVSGQDYLSYNIYLDAIHRTVWGDGTSGTDFYVDTKPPNNTPVAVSVFGRVPALQDVATGQYADVLQVRIIF